jgi:ketosteroid isomerase-like protein
VSRENVEIVEGVYERWSQGDFRTTDVLAPDAVLVMRPGLPDVGTYEGLEGFAAYMRGFLEPWTHITITAEEIIEAGDGRVVVTVNQRGVGSVSGIATELHYAHLWSFRDGKAVRLEAYREREDCFRAAGLEPG